MKYEISTVAQLKADIVDAIEKGVVMTKRDLASTEAFDAAVGGYVDMCRDAAAIKPGLYPAARTLQGWFNELKAAA